MSRFIGQEWERESEGNQQKGARISALYWRESRESDESDESNSKKKPPFPADDLPSF
jgi:hypothetical protein